MTARLNQRKGNGKGASGVSLSASRMRGAAILVAALVLTVEMIAPAELHAKPIRIRLQDDLSFGRIAPSPNQPGSVVIAAASGAKTTQGGAVDLGGVHGRATFLVQGDKHTLYSISLSGSVALSSPQNQSITVNAFTSSPAGSGVLPTNGNAIVGVGATLHIGASQNPGNYSGAYFVTVNYQ